MVNIIYDGGSASQAQNLITFTDFPNILMVDDSVSYATKAYYELDVFGNLKNATERDGQWHITIFGDTITNVTDPLNAVNKNFCVMADSTSTAASMVKALRNCPNIAANFVVYHDANTITVEAREAGSIFNGSEPFETDIPSTYMEVEGYDGHGSDLQGAKIDVDIISDGRYITTLEKNWYKNGVEFNVSPVLTTLAKYGETVPYSFKISSISSDGQYGVLGYVNNNYITAGYLCNQGYGVLMLGSTVQLAQNVMRGENRGYANNTRLYVYQPNIRVSYYATSSPTITVRYLDSAMNQIASTPASSHILNYDSRLKDVSIDLNTSYFNQAFYVEVAIDDITLIYEVIKPLKATEYAQRIYWRNSYGGVSFFDFTGSRSETRNLEVTTYQESIYDAVKASIREYRNNSYQTMSYAELTKPYNNKVDYSVTLKSHLFEHDGKYIFNDLIQSGKIWTEINNNFYEIILDSVSVEEQNNNDIYEATVKYHYSQVPSEIE
jgi:hypothetical protein